MQPAPGSPEQKIADYLITAQIHGNDKEKVYQALSPKGRKVMLRVFENAAAHRARFNELLAKLITLNHPNVVATLDYGEANGLLYQVSEFVPEGSLDNLLYRLNRSLKKLPLTIGLMLIRDAALALEAAHAAEVVHGDLRPDNLLLERLDGSDAYVGKLGDFGLNQIFARPVRDLSDLLGSPNYMAPEQFQGRPITPQTDIYSLGIMLYELATGELPFRGKNTRDLARMHSYDEPPQPQNIRPELLPELVEVIQKALRKSPEERYASVGDMARGVQEVLDLIGPPLTDLRLRPTRRREPERSLASPPVALVAPKDVSRYPRLSIYDGTNLTVVPLNPEAPLSLGRSDKCAIQLTHEAVSRNHALINWNGERVTIQQTGATNPTYLLGGAQAEPLGLEPVVWPWHSTIYLHPYWLRLDPPRSRIGVNAQEELVLVPGVPTPLSINLKNLGDKVDTFVVELEGVPNEWLHSVAETRLNPDTTADLTLVFLAPKTSQTRSGEHAAHLLVRSTMDATEAQRVPLRLNVQPFVSSQLSLSPSRVRTRSSALLSASIKNTGNQVARYTLDYNPAPTSSFTVQIGDQKGATMSGLNENQRGMLRNWFRMLTAPLQNTLRRLWERNVGGALRKGQWVKEQADQFMGAGSGGSQAKPSQPGLPSTAPNEVQPRVWTVEPGQTLEVPVWLAFPPVLLGRTHSTAVELEARPFGLPKEARVEPSLAKALLDHSPILPMWLVPAALLVGAVAFFLLNRAPTIENFATGDGSLVRTVNEKFVVNYKVAGARSLEIRSPVYKEPIRLDPQSSQYELPAFTRPTASGGVELKLVARGLIRSSEAKLPLTVQNAPTPEPRLNLNLVSLVGGQERTVREFRRNQTVYLKWWARNYEEIRLSGLEGRTLSKSPMPLSNLPPGIYNLVLSARNGDKRAQATLNFTVKGLPAEIEFSIRPERFALGREQNLTASWRTQNATKVSTSFSGDVQPSGRASIPAPVTAGSTQYTLTAIGEDGVSLERKVTVSVLEPPTPSPDTPIPVPPPPPPVLEDATIGEFRIEPRQYTAGEQQNLRVVWSTKNSTRVTLSTVSRVLPAEGTLTLKAPIVAGDVTYTLTARGENGKTIRETRTVRVLEAHSPVQPPVSTITTDVIIGDFRIEPRQYTAGERQNLRVVWSTENSTRVTLSTVSDILPAEGTLTLKAPTVAGDVTYTLTARGENGKTVRETFTVTVLKAPAPTPPPPQPATIESFSAEINNGRVTFSWSTKNATQVSLEPFGTVGSSGNRDTPAPPATNDYALTVRGSDGKVVKKSIQVLVGNTGSLRCGSLGQLPSIVDSGKLAREDIYEGTGEAVKISDVVTIKYIGRFKDGGYWYNSCSEIEEEQTIGQDFFGLGIVGMKYGGRRRIFVPRELTGDLAQGIKDKFLVIDIELLEIKR